jgi:glycosyltransferase involved in cell wall biosynthesis
MAVGTPVVGSATGGAAEYLVDGENALLVSPDAGELAAAAGRLAADVDLRKRLREGGQATAGRYSERAYNEAIAAALERAASE